MRIPSRIKQPLIRLRLGLKRRRHKALFQGRRVALAQALPRLEAIRQQGGETAVDNRMTASTGRALRNRFLADALAGKELGVWALDADTLDFLEREIKTRRPAAILEFGAGLSTVCLAQYLQEAGYKPETPCLFSIEQNEWQVEKSQQELEALGLSAWVRILHSPVTAVTIAGIPMECYTLSADTLHNFLGEVRPEMVLIDGPCGDALVRLGTLPLVHEYLNAGAVFYLDDALRAEETEIARYWNDLPYIEDVYLYYRGKGLWIGKIVL